MSTKREKFKWDVADSVGSVFSRGLNRDRRKYDVINQNLFKYAVGDGVLQEPGYPVGGGVDNRTYKYFEIEVNEQEPAKILIGDGQAIVDGVRVGNTLYKSTDQDIIDMSAYLNISQNKTYGIFIVAHIIEIEESDDSEDIGLSRYAKPDYEVIDVTGEDLIERREQKILIGTVTIVSGVISTIDNSVQKYLQQRDNIVEMLQEIIDTESNKIRRELYAALEALKSEMLTEIAHGDQTVLDELNTQVAALNILIVNNETSISVIQAALTTLSNYVDAQLSEIAEITTELTEAIIELQNAATDSLAFQTQVNVKLAQLEGDIVANLAQIQSNEARIETIELGNLITAGKYEKDNAIDIMDLSFRMSHNDGIYTTGLNKGKVIIFSDASEIDDANSDNYVVNAVEKIVKPTPVLSEDLVALWRMDSGVGKVVVDGSGHDNDGAIVGQEIWVDGVSGKALEFNGLNYVVTSLNMEQEIGDSNPFSIVYWIYPHALDLGYNMLFGNYGITSYMPNSGRPTISFGGIVKYRFDALICPINTWTYFAFVFDGNYLHGYKNGGSKVTAPNPVPRTDMIAEPFHIGSSHYGGVGFKGIIDEFGVFNRALSDAEILAIFNDGIGAGDENPAVVQLNPLDTGIDPTSIILATDRSTSGVAYKISRDGGTTPIAITPGVELDMTGQPAGHSIVLKADIPVGGHLGGIGKRYSTT